MLMVRRGDDHLFRKQPIGSQFFLFFFLIILLFLIFLAPSTFLMIMANRLLLTSLPPGRLLAEIGAQYGPQVPHIPDDPLQWR